MNPLGKLLTTLRLQHGLSQAKLADRAHIAVRTLQYWESSNQQPRDVELEKLRLICTRWR